MYRIQYYNDDYASRLKHVTFLDHKSLANFEATGVRVIGDNYYCDIGGGLMHVFPVNRLISIDHIPGTPVLYDEEAGGGLVYRQYYHVDKSPTGLASYNPESLCHWILEGYDVVIDSYDGRGNINPIYVCATPNEPSDEDSDTF